MTTAPASDAQTSVLDDRDVLAAVDQRQAIDAVRRVLRSAHRGDAKVIAKSMTAWDGPSTAHTLGAVDQESGLAAFKNWVNTPSGASAVMNVFDAHSGELLMALQAGRLGSLRTAATAAAATDAMADEQADVVGLLGTGRQAYQQVVALRAVRRIDTVRVWSPDQMRRDEFAHRIEAGLGLRVESCPDPRTAVRDAPIVTTITRAVEPFVDRAWLAHGCHVNAMGAILPTSAELLPGVIEASDLSVVDDLENAMRASRELKDALGAELAGVLTLGEVLEKDLRRPADAALTLFKGMGSGLSDLGVAAVVLENCRERTELS
ncbi:ornithine cyclodeaminase family protein [Gordonia rhizosphera]|uniref:Ornithine cyclodeaminase n=1 Tax=Gordonia rhizosphera NBRC 16068 TaxID=1108045 RepID=K6VYN5_9ACTN|nr:ornithine cyclodeaminase family protein [Gordonia rhizosphera]GAB92015.1 ornithine cyclodeaminase [Gordonia rhizosphera NBRC 16068]